MAGSEIFGPFAQLTIVVAARRKVTVSIKQFLRVMESLREGASLNVSLLLLWNRLQSFSSNPGQRTGVSLVHVQQGSIR
ncbi:MAG: hypothetical protein CMJ73_02520 [Planctomycetaceae bacterium]|nr:hypothetical protein [Planctomycetaceae bacterium]